MDLKLSLCKTTPQKRRLLAVLRRKRDIPSGNLLVIR
jgi:hypothetical protein